MAVMWKHAWAPLQIAVDAAAAAVPHASALLQAAVSACDRTLVAFAHAHVCRHEDPEDDDASIYEVRFTVVMLGIAGLAASAVAILWLCCWQTLSELYLHPDRFEISADKVAPSLARRTAQSPAPRRTSRPAAELHHERASPAREDLPPPPARHTRGEAPASPSVAKYRGAQALAPPESDGDAVIEHAMHALHPLVASASQTDADDALEDAAATMEGTSAAAAGAAPRRLQPATCLAHNAVETPDGAHGDGWEKDTPDSGGGRLTPSLAGSTRFNASSTYRQQDTASTAPRFSRSDSMAACLPGTRADTVGGSDGPGSARSDASDRSGVTFSAEATPCPSPPPTLPGRSPDADTDGGEAIGVVAGSKVRVGAAMRCDSSAAAASLSPRQQRLQAPKASVTTRQALNVLLATSGRG